MFDKEFEEKQGREANLELGFEDEISKPSECPVCGSKKDLHHVTHVDGVTCHIQCGLIEGEGYRGCDWKSEPFRRRKSCNVGSSEPWGKTATEHREYNKTVAEQLDLKYCKPGKESFTDINGKVHITGSRWHILCPYCGEGADHCACNCPKKWENKGNQ